MKVSKKFKHFYFKILFLIVPDEHIDADELCLNLTSTLSVHPKFASLVAEIVAALAAKGMYHLITKELNFIELQIFEGMYFIGCNLCALSYYMCIYLKLPLNSQRCSKYVEQYTVYR